MQDEPSGAALLDAARRALTEEVVPGLTGRPRYVALMVTNAIGIAAREIVQADRLAKAGARVLDGAGAPDNPMENLVRTIREGQHDADEDLQAALTEAVEVAAQIWKPSAPDK
ncbi:DUF6285 domain-containing protein [Methylobacterium sp. J-077]|uniref:DUF6285 domain-containing protein n=1 Tax=Methylobacterium sp. J-077 TaxID=2836656 RepID=UPI001FB8AB19|nr:DUF6285 domain-containing protein [Methylobacterium sp. J-077]MCJ2125888.1 DUF6285 domain-containing protein [Methylobacterium sp. J-077]